MKAGENMLFKFRLWRMKRFLVKATGHVELTRKWKDLRIKCVKDDNGMRLVVHRHVPGDKFWTYLNYDLHEDMTLVLDAKRPGGKYPATFVRNVD